MITNSRLNQDLKDVENREECYVVVSVRKALNDTGDNGERDTPVLIPNTAVKPPSADGTWLETARESRTLPVTI